MKYGEAYRKVLSDFNDEANAVIGRFVETAEKNKGYWGKLKYQEESDRVESTIEDLKKKYVLMLENLNNRFSEDNEKYGRLEGNRLNMEDLELVKSVYLNTREINQLLDKYKGNFPMLKAIMDNVRPKEEGYQLEEVKDLISPEGRQKHFSKAWDEVRSSIITFNTDEGMNQNGNHYLVDDSEKVNVLNEVLGDVGIS